MHQSRIRFVCALMALAALIPPLHSAWGEGDLPVKLTANWPADQYVRFQGDPIRLQIHVQADCFVTILALDVNGRVRVVWPNREDYCNHLWAGERKTVTFQPELVAADPGPVYLHLLASEDKDFRFHYQDGQAPYLIGGPYARRGRDPLFLTNGDQDFPLAFGVSYPRHVRDVTRWEADALAAELDNAIYHDYDRFVPVADRFLSWIHAKTRHLHPRTYGSDDLDIYVAPWRFSPRSYRLVAGGYQPPTGGQFRPVIADPFTTYGRWLTINGHRAWSPDVWPGWRPFMNGYWAWTNRGWTWISYEPWGSITDHYGFWAWHPRWKWVWIPDSQWRPAPVTWFSYRDRIAWFPSSPPPAKRRALGTDLRFGEAVPDINIVDVDKFARHDLSDHLTPPDSAQREFKSNRRQYRDDANGPSLGRIAGQNRAKPKTVELKPGKPVDLGTGVSGLTPYLPDDMPPMPKSLSDRLGQRKPDAAQTLQAPADQPKKAQIKTRNPAKGERYSMPKIDLQEALKADQ